jgi:hypothetical protein
MIPIISLFDRICAKIIERYQAALHREDNIL